MHSNKLNKNRDILAWAKKGKEVNTNQSCDCDGENVTSLNSNNFKKASCESIMKHPEEMQEKNHQASRHCRMQKQLEFAKHKISGFRIPICNGKNIGWFPMDLRNDVHWGIYRNAVKAVSDRHIPIVSDGLMQWEYVPEARK